MKIPNLSQLYWIIFYQIFQITNDRAQTQHDHENLQSMTVELKKIAANLTNILEIKTLKQIFLTENSSDINTLYTFYVNFSTKFSIRQFLPCMSHAWFMHSHAWATCKMLALHGCRWDLSTSKTKNNKFSTSKCLCRTFGIKGFGSYA